MINNVQGFMVNRRFGGLLGGLIILMLHACFEPREGCLDIAATNFNAAADEDCCCQYPKLVLSIDQVYDTQYFRKDSLYAGTGGHLFKINKIVFYLSDFTLAKSGQNFEVSDSIALNMLDAASGDTLEQNYKNDFALVRRTPFEYTIGTLREDGFFDQVNFRLGLRAEIDAVIPALVPTSSSLAVQAENLADNGYVYLQVVVTRDSMANTAADTLNFNRADIGDFFIQENGVFEHRTGYDFPLTLHADWAKLFEGVIWTTYDKTAWKARIVANLPSVFSVSQ